MTKTTDQLRAIFGLGKNLGMAKEDLEEMAYDLTGGSVERLSQLTFAQANAMIERLGGEAFEAAAGVPKRTENYRKQVAGIKIVETQKHLDMIAELARLRGIGSEGVAKLAARMKVAYPPRTTEEGNKLVEALKAMNVRDGLMPPPTKTPTARSGQKWRKVA